MRNKFIYNNRILENYRKELRNQLTEAERKLWLRIRNKQINRFRFLRQYSTGPYILDFYCSKVRLALEVDGSQHLNKEHIIYDNDRSNYLKSINIRVLRFSNNEVFDNIESVLKVIKNNCLVSPLK